MSSPPARGRGLKLAHVSGRVRADVAPRAGAGIETDDQVSTGGVCAVAPRAGAGIETRLQGLFHRGYWSPPARGRGLKPV